MLILPIAAACAMGTSRAATLEEAEAAYKNGRYEQTFGAFSSAAAKGDAFAQNRLGEMYGLGHGVRADAAKAVDWYARAAAQGHLEAQNNLGAMYYGRRDFPQALKWFLKAAKAGNAAAQFNVGNVFYNGDGVARDYVKAARWYEMAGKQGHALAQNNLGFMFADGRGLRRDSVKAYQWYRLASVQGNESARRSLEAVGERMSLEEISEAKKHACDLRPSCCEDHCAAPNRW